MLCPNCGKHEMRIMANLTFSCPSDWFHRLTKKKMTSKDFEVWGVDWDFADFICPKCGLIINGSAKKYKNANDEEE